MAMTRTIELKTAVPGPKSREILARKERVVADPLSVFLPVVIEEGRGATLTDVDGNTFLDFTAGVGCLNVGHSHPRVVAAAQEQLTKFSHTDFTIVPYEVYVTLAERLCGLAPMGGETRAAFFNAGTEAIENAIKFARSYTKRPAVIAFEGGFHGRTLLSMSLTSKTHPYKAGLGPFSPEVYRVPFAQDYRGPTAPAAPGDLERALMTQVAAEQVAAIVIEPEQGGRAVLDVFEEEGRVERAGAIGETIRERMVRWQDRFAAIGDVRGLGAMLAIELVADRETKQPAPELASAVTEAAAARGLLLLKS